MKQTILIFGTVAVIIFFIVELSKHSIYSFSWKFTDLFLLLASLIFIILGIFLNRFMNSPPAQRRSVKLSNSLLSKQELKILGLMNDGMSNGEIADRLFIAESTVKKHVSNILSKLKARRRTEAIRIGRELNLI